jgi:CspA family cold shock protein
LNHSLWFFLLSYAGRARSRDARRSLEAAPTARGERVPQSIFAACQEYVHVSQGTIKKLTDKGFGFIKGDKGEIFFHSSSLEGTSYESLSEGQQVEYTEGKGPKGPRAENVRVIG